MGRTFGGKTTLKILFAFLLAAASLYAQKPWVGQLNTVSGTGRTIATTAGPQTPGSLVVIDSDGNHVAGGQGSLDNRLPVGVNAVFEGDSLTVGYTLTKSAYNTTSCKTSVSDSTCQDWPSQLMLMSALKGRALTKNIFAVAGNTIDDLQGRYTSSVHLLSPSATGKSAILFVWVGANDYHGGTSASDFETALSAYWAEAKTDGFKLAVGTIMQYGGDTTTTHELARRQINEWIKSQFYKGSFDYLFDFAATFPNPYDQTFFASDHIHLNQAGHYLAAKMVNGVLCGDDIRTPAVSSNSPLGTGDANEASGFNALISLTTGAKNVAFGPLNSDALTTGSNNTAVGYGALHSITTASSNVAIGSQAGVNATGGSNVFVGANAGSSNKGGNNVAVGYSALSAASTTANNNVVIGYNAGTALTSSTDTLIGAQAGASLTAGQGNIAIGYTADIGATSTNAAQIGAGKNTLDNSLQFRSITVTAAPVTVANLPTCNSTTEGSTLPVSDSNSTTFHATLAGGGNSHVRAYCDGTNWVVD
jgi:hypothetical protein